MGEPSRVSSHMSSPAPPTTSPPQLPRSAGLLTGRGCSSGRAARAGDREDGVDHDTINLIISSEPVSGGCGLTCWPEADPHPAQKVAGPERPVDLIISTALLVLVLVVTTMSVQTGGLPRGLGWAQTQPGVLGQPPSPHGGTQTAPSLKVPAVQM